MDATNAISWLHLSDLHVGMKAQESYWPTIREILCDDLALIHDRCGPWDLVLFTGDLTNRGTEKEFHALDGILDELMARLEELGSTPVLLAVPGNHDLVRPPPLSAPAKILKRWHEEGPDVHEDFWTNKDSAYRQVVAEAFRPYQQWWERRRPKDVRPGLLPGDFSYVHSRGDKRLGILGLNSAFLHLSDGNHKGHLALDVHQMAQACGDGPTWARRCDACLLLTHHPPDWLDPGVEDRQYRGEIYTSDYFDVHLYGHMHDHHSQSTSTGGSAPRRHSQGSSLFGREFYGKKKETRQHGYAAGRIRFKKTDRFLDRWPRKAELELDRTRKIIPDLRYELNDQEALVEKLNARRSAPAAKTPPPPPRPQLKVDLQVPIQGPGGPYHTQWYVRRPDEEHLARSTLDQAGIAVLLWGPSYYGKSWLLDYLLESELEQDQSKGLHSKQVKIELDTLDTLGSGDQLLHQIGMRVAQQLDRHDVVRRLKTEKWDDPVLELTNLMKYDLLPKVEGRLFLAIDRLDCILGQRYTAPFEGMLRSWLTYLEPWARLRLLLVSSTGQAQAGGIYSSSLENTSQKIHVTDFTAEQVRELARRCYGQDFSEEDVRGLLRFVGGHPFLLREVLREAASHARPLRDLIQDRRVKQMLMNRLDSWHQKLFSDLERALFSLLDDPGFQPKDDDVHQRLIASMLVRKDGDRRLVLHCELYQQYFEERRQRLHHAP